MPTETPALVLALGGFDGVHLGHRRILDRARLTARRLDGSVGVLTYDPLPAQAIYPDFTYVLTPLADKVRLLAELGVEEIHVLRFDDSLRATEPETFVQRHIVDAHRPAAVVIGHDHRFGCRGRGDAGLLGQLLADRGIEVDVVPECLLGGVPVRSTVIREQLLLGHVGRAAELLGRYYALAGSIVPGTGTGRRLGFPTINLRPFERETLVPADGVYVCRVDAGGRRWDAVLNIGHRPTFGGETRTIEAHLLGVAGDMAIDRASFHVIDRIRPERRFASPGELAVQIAADIARARSILARLPSLPNLDSCAASNNL